MLRRNKIETVGTIKEFRSGEWKFKKEINKANRKLIGYGIKIGLATVAGVTMLDISIPVAMASELASICGGSTVETLEVFNSSAPVEAVEVYNAEGGGGYIETKIKEKIMNAFTPIIELIKLLAHPIAGIMITSGSLLYMIGRQDKGIDMVQKAAIGYILVQMSDLFLQLIVGIGSAI